MRFEGFVVVHVIIIVVHGRQIGLNPRRHDAECTEVFNHLNGHVKTPVCGDVHVPEPIGAVALDPRGFAPLPSTRPFFEDQIPVVGLRFAVEFDGPTFTPRRDLKR